MSASTSAALRGRVRHVPDGLHTVALADGTVVAALLDSPADAPAPVTAVLVHGWTQDHTSWEDVAPRLLAAGLRILAPDARGHGWSDAGRRGTGTVNQLADDLAEVIAALAPAGDLVLAGHSLGGPVLMALTERHPRLLERVCGVALVATSAAGLGRDLFGLPPAVTGPARTVTQALTGLRTRSRGRVNLRYSDPLAALIRTGFYGPGLGTSHNRRRTAAQVGRSHPSTTAQLVQEMLRHDRLAGLAGLDRPSTVVLAGTRDGLCPIAHSRAMATAMPSARLVVYPGAGHMLPYERAEEVADQIVHLARPAPRTGLSPVEHSA